MRRGTKIGLIVLAIIFVPMFYGCGRVEWKHSRVRPGMTVAQVLEVTDGWWMCDGFSDRAKPEEPRHFWMTGSDGHYLMSLRVDHIDYDSEAILSEAEMISRVEQTMSDRHPWRLSFSYFASVPPRMAFAVEFDAQGRVTSVGDTVGAD